MTGKLPAPEVFGPQGAHVVALLERARRLTPDEASALGAARDAALGAARGAAWDAALDAACGAALDAALDAAWGAAWCAAWGAARAIPRGAARDAALDAACGAACGLVVRDVITTEDYDILTRAWRTVIGPIHPEDEFWAAVAKAAK